MNRGSWLSGFVEKERNLEINGNRSDKLRSRHVLTNILIDVVDENTQGITYLSLYRHIGPESLEDNLSVLLDQPQLGIIRILSRLQTRDGDSLAEINFAFQNKEIF